MWCFHLKPWCTHSNKTTTRANEFRAKCYRKHISESQRNSRAHGFVPDQVVSRRAYGADCSGKPCRKQHHTWMTIFFFHLVGHSLVRSFRNSTVVAPVGSKLALKMRRHDHRATRAAQRSSHGDPFGSRRRSTRRWRLQRHRLLGQLACEQTWRRMQQRMPHGH